MKIDMHIHSNFSDGLLSVEEIEALARTKKLTGISITDHDNIDAIKEFLKLDSNINLINGVELSSYIYGEEVHILGYFFDEQNEELLSLLSFLKKERLKRVKKIINKLRKDNINIKIDYNNTTLGRPHIARELVSKGYTKNVQTAFTSYLSTNSKYYVNKYKLPILKAIKTIKNANGITVLAHPKLISNKNIIKKVIDLGIDGIECYHSKHSIHDEIYFKKIAKLNSLLITGGSDCHGVLINEDYLLGSKYIVEDEIRKLKEGYN